MNPNPNPPSPAAPAAIAVSAGPALSVIMSGRALEIPADHFPPRLIHHHGHADVIFVVAASAKNVISPAKKSEARAAKALLDAHKAGTALLASEELTKNQKLVAGAAIAADKRFVMVTMPTNGQLKLEAGDAFGPFQVLTDFELPLMADGKAHGEFRIEIMAVDLHDADIAPSAPPTLSLQLHASETIVPKSWLSRKRYHGHADVIFVVAVSAKNVVDAKLKAAAEVAEQRLSALKADPVANALSPKQVAQFQDDLAAYVAEADKRFAIVTTQPLKLTSGTEHNQSAMPVLTAFELPISRSGSVHATFHVEIMAVDLHKAQSRRQLEQLFNRPPPSLLAQVSAHMSKLEDERLQEETKLFEFASTAIDRVVGGLLSHARTATAVAAPAAIPSLAFLETAIKDIHTIVGAYRKTSIVSDVLGTLVLAGSLSTREGAPTLLFSQPHVRISDDKVEVSPVQVQTAEPKAFANGKSTMLSSTLEHWFGNQKATSEVKTTIVVAANL